jgi:hypothetical protein
MSNQVFNVPGRKYLDVPPEISRTMILKASAQQIRDWARTYGFENLNLRLIGQK